VNFPASLPTHPASQQPPPQTVDLHQQEGVGLLHLGHSVGCQTQLFPDKSLYEHLGSVLSYSLAGNTKIIETGVPFKSLPERNSKQSKGFNCNYTFWRGTRFFYWSAATLDGCWQIPKWQRENYGEFGQSELRRQPYGCLRWALAYSSR
jgi:hypothetical protein